MTNFALAARIRELTALVESLTEERNRLRDAIKKARKLLEEATP